MLCSSPLFIERLVLIGIIHYMRQNVPALGPLASFRWVYYKIGPILQVNHHDMSVILPGRLASYPFVYILL